MSILTLSGASQEVLLTRSAVASNYIVPAATFTATTPTSADSGAKTTLTSSGAHGLTAAVAVGKSLYITDGTGWIAGLYNISSIDLDTTGVAVTIDVAFDAGFGTPTIALANTSAVFATIAIPPLGINSHIEIDVTWSFPSNGNTKIPEIKLGGSAYYNPSITTSLVCRPTPIVIQNRGATNSQVSAHTGVSGAQSNIGGAAVTTSSIDTSIESILTIGGKAVTANDFVVLERYLVKYYL